MATMYRHATANLLKDLRQHAVEDDLAEVLASCDVAGFQEVNSVGHRVAVEHLHAKGWGVYWPGGKPSGKPDGANQIPLVWRSAKFTVLTTGREKMFAGGMGSPSRWIAWVVLKDKKTGEIICRMNTHFIQKAWTDNPERRPAWNHHETLMVAQARALAKKYGSCIGAGDMNRSGHDFADFQMVYPNEGTFGGAKYDYFFVAGTHLTNNTEHVVNTNSDHDAFLVNFAGIPAAHAPEVKPTAPKPVDASVFAPPKIPGYGLHGAKGSSRPLRSRIRYLCCTMNGDGSQGTFLDTDLPLTNVSTTDNLSGYNSMTATITPQFRRLLAPGGEPLFGEWSHAIFAEQDGEILGGGIVKKSTFDGPQWQIETTGFAGYADGMPWVTSDAGNYLGVGVDPFDVVRVIWGHIQSQPHGNLGLELSPANIKAGYTIGVTLQQVEYDTQSGPMAFESGPVQINWYTDTNLGDRLNDLAKKTPFDWRERHVWSGGSIRHVLELGYPDLGSRRDGLRFVVGENVDTAPTVEHDGDQYATEVMTLGSGEGRAMIRGASSRPRTGLRRVAVVQDSSITTVTAANQRAEEEVAARAIIDDVTSFVVRDTPLAPIGSYEVGDEIYLSSREGWRPYGAWVRITSIARQPGTNSDSTLTVIRPDRIGQ